MSKKRCPFCKTGRLKRTKKPLKFEYKGHSLKLEQPGEYCDSCEEGIVDGFDIKMTEKELQDWHREVDGFLTTSQIRRIRKRLKLTQHQAAEIFGGGQNAFSRYERGEIRQTKALDQLLRLLDRYPEHLQELIKSEAA